MYLFNMPERAAPSLLLKTCMPLIRLASSFLLKSYIWNPLVRPSPYFYSTFKYLVAMSSQYTFPNDQPIVYLECQKAFEGLTNQEKLYSHYLSKACWYGGLIVLYQTSPESPLIYLLFQRIFAKNKIETIKSIAIDQCSFTEDDFKAFLVYFCGLLTNMGNYKGFGDSKFIPNLSQAKFEDLIKALSDPEILSLWEKCKDAVYSLEETQKHLGFSEKGVTTYFSKHCTKKDSEIVNQFFKEKGLEAYNTRLFKLSQDTYEVRLASVASLEDNEDNSLISTHELKSIPGYKFNVTRGDYGPLLGMVNSNLIKAKEYAANENERLMLENYIHSFKTGSLDHHKDGSRFWIKDKGPVVETYIGFIETYRDPAGMRGEFEGFVAVVNKSMSQKFADLVANAEVFLPHLPWPSSFEKDAFLRPDFTSLDVLTFAGSGIPAGICIPNYDEVRQNEGFKNVSLGNVIPASYKDSTPNYLEPSDQQLLKDYRVCSFELQVGLHELLGHGSGKLFQKNKDGTLNFDINTVINPLTKEKISTFYDVGETYDSVFMSLGSSYEECRAECVGLFLSTEPKIVKIFGYEGEEAENVIYVNWLSLLHSGIEGLQMYDVGSQTWLQAHSQARFVILQVLLEAGQGLVSLTETTGSDDKPDLKLTLDRSKILSVGKPVIGDFLQKLQVYKATADIKSAREMYEKYSNVDKTFVQYHAIVMDRKKPRKMFAQSNTTLQDGEVSLQPYDSTPEGLIQSWIDRFQLEELESTMMELWKKDQPYFS